MENRTSTNNTGSQEVIWNGRDASILLHPNIPKPLHGIAPRVILGDEWWEKTKREAKDLTKDHCAACGVHVRCAREKPWLECHEMYEIDYEEGRAAYVRTVPLCHFCHNFIHSGRMGVLVATGKQSQRWAETILEHGYDILEEAGLRKEYEKMWNKMREGGGAPWEDWRMIIFDKEYGPSSLSFAEWEQGAWKNWKPARPCN